MAIRRWETFSSRRCAGKIRFSKLRDAERRAEALSLRQGELLLAYQCADCSRFHVGHADTAQKLVRGIGTLKPCPACGTHLYEPARPAEQPTWNDLYCSPECREAGSLRRGSKRAGSASVDSVP